MRMCHQNIIFLPKKRKDSFEIQNKRYNDFLEKKHKNLSNRLVDGLLNISNKEYETVEENQNNEKISINHNNLKRIINIRSIMSERDKDRSEIKNANKENLNDKMKMSRTLLKYGTPLFIKMKFNI